MADKPVLQPGPDHPITVTPNPEQVVVRVAGKLVADTRRALTLQEAAYPAVQYIPIEDVDQSLLQASDTTPTARTRGTRPTTRSPMVGQTSVDAIWVYTDPHEAVAEIRNHVAFYPDRVDAIEVGA